MQNIVFKIQSNQKHEVMDMLDHQKAMLEQVIGSDELFEKELKKSLKWLTTKDVRKLYIWLKEKFGSSHNEIIQTVFLKEVVPIIK